MNFLINPDITKTLSYTALFYILNSDAKNIIFSKIPQLEQLITANCELSKILSLTLMFLGICIFYNKFIHQSTPETGLDDIMRNALLSSIIFFIVSNTSTYSVTNMLFNGMLLDSGCPSKEGIILHTIVFAILLYLFNYLDNLDEECDFDKYINNNCNVDNLKKVERYQSNDTEEHNNVNASIEQVGEQEDRTQDRGAEVDNLRDVERRDLPEGAYDRHSLLHQRRRSCPQEAPDDLLGSSPQVRYRGKAAPRDDSRVQRLA